MTSTIDWDAIDTVLLDMDGTILDLSFDNFFWLEYLPQIYAERNGLSLAQSDEFLKTSYGAIEGKLQWYCLDFWSERLGIDISQLKHSVRDRIAFRPGAVQFLEFLVAQKKRVYLVTNAHRKSLEIKLLNASFHQYFNHLISSHDYGYPKEEQDFWHTLNKHHPFDKDRTLFIDDSVRILRSAHEYGIRHLFGIAKPDKHKPAQDCSPFTAIHDFVGVIANDR